MSGQISWIILLTIASSLLVIASGKTCTKELVHTYVVYRMNPITQRLTTAIQFKKSIVFVCCEGYKDISRNRMQPHCEPICKQPCGHGICYSPNLCACDLGYKHTELGTCVPDENLRSIEGINYNNPWLNSYLLPVKNNSKPILTTTTHKPHVKELDTHLNELAPSEGVLTTTTLKPHFKELDPHSDVPDSPEGLLTTTNYKLHLDPHLNVFESIPEGFTTTTHKPHLKELDPHTNILRSLEGISTLTTGKPHLKQLNQGFDVSGSPKGMTTTHKSHVKELVPNLNVIRSLERILTTTTQKPHLKKLDPHKFQSLEDIDSTTLTFNSNNAIPAVDVKDVNLIPPTDEILHVPNQTTSSKPVESIYTTQSNIKRANILMEKANVSNCGTCDKGICISNICVCRVGFKLSHEGNCHPVCSETCLNGRCIAPYHCECLDGYTYDSESLLCKPLCNGKIYGCIRGTCVGYNQCRCDNGTVLDKDELFHCVEGESLKQQISNWSWSFLLLLLLPASIIFIIFYIMIARWKKVKANRLEAQEGGFSEVRYYNSNNDHSVNEKHQRACLKEERSMDEPSCSRGAIQRNGNVVIIST